MYEFYGNILFMFDLISYNSQCNLRLLKNRSTVCSRDLKFLQDLWWLSSIKIKQTFLHLVFRFWKITRTEHLPRTFQTGAFSWPGGPRRPSSGRSLCFPPRTGIGELSRSYWPLEQMETYWSRETTRQSLPCCPSHSRWSEWCNADLWSQLFCTTLSHCHQTLHNS